MFDTLNPDFYFLDHMKLNVECRRSANLKLSSDPKTLHAQWSSEIHVTSHQKKVEHIRKDFPFFSYPDNPIWFDNAATTQKPESVISAQDRFYRKDYSNINRGEHRKAKFATELYEEARKKSSKSLDKPGVTPRRK